MSSAVENPAAHAPDARRRLLGCLERRESRYRLGNDPETVAELIRLLREEFEALDVGDPATRMGMTVALQEALSNALYHGNLEVSSDLRREDERPFYALARRRRVLAPYRDRRITVHARLGPGEARFVVADEGPGFDTSRLDRLADPDDLTAIGGRGLVLIRAFMDEVTFNPSGNVITMVKALHPAPG